MSNNYVEYNDMIAFHPGYYIKELVVESGLTQEDFAKRLDTTPKNLSLLIRGEQSLSKDIAMKLSRMIGTSITYWLNLQNTYDATIAEFDSEKELDAERVIFKCLDYKYFKEHFALPNLPRKIDEQIVQVRNFLNVATLSVLAKRDMAVNFRSSTKELPQESIIRANAMVQIAVNKALKIETPNFNKAKFEKAVNYAVTLTENHTEFSSLIEKAFSEAGVVFIILPNMAGLKINGATKKLGNKIVLMVNDRRLNADTFWFTLFHEIGHIMNGDYGISFDKEEGEQELAANKYAEDNLIPKDLYKRFICQGRYDIHSIIYFANQIKRDPGIVLGRLQNDGKVRHDDKTLSQLRHKYQVQTIV